MKRFYAGIGSRETPKEILHEMSLLASILEERGFTLRSGNAEGADQAFASGVKSQAQIWLPWFGFQREFSRRFPEHDYLVISDVDREAFASVLKYHPAGNSLNDTSRLFMARNFRQVIGSYEPNSEFVVCWTPEAKLKGGTSQAMRIASDLKIPIINMFEYPTADAVLNCLDLWHGVFD